MRTEVLVIGGGAAGIEVATAVRRAVPDHQVTLVAPDGELVYRPWLVYLPAGKLDVQALRLPMPPIASRSGFAFHRGDVGKLQLDQDQVVLADGERIDYDYVVVAVGAPADRARIPGAADHALFPCEQADAQRFAQAVGEEPDGPVTVVATGERIGPALEFAGWTARRLHRDHAPTDAQHVRLVDDNGALRRQFGRAAGKVAAVAASLGIDVVGGTSVSEITDGHLHLADGRSLASALTALATPLRGPGPELGLPAAALDPHGFVIADPTLRLRAAANAFVVGDALRLHDVSPPLPKTWGMARLQAATAAANIAALLTSADRPLVPLDLRRIRRLTALSMPDIGGRTVLVRKGRVLASGAWPLRLRYRLDRTYLRRYSPTPDTIPTPARL